MDIVFGFSKMPFEDKFFAVYEFFHSVLLSKGARVWGGLVTSGRSQRAAFEIMVGFRDRNVDGRIGSHRTLLDPWCCRRRAAKGTSKV